MTRCHFPYGHKSLQVNLPADYNLTFLNSRFIKGLADPEEAIISGLRSPIGCQPLIKCVHPGNKVTVIVTDNTRACPDAVLLPPILAEIEQQTSTENITIIIALGLHAPLSRKEMIEKFDSQIVDKYRIVNHDAGQVNNIGVTSRGIPIEVNPQVLESDFCLSTGFIEPHFFAGFSGGRKSILPGVSSARSIRLNHGFNMIDHPLARAGVLKGNPVHEDMVEHARAAGLDFILNVLLNEKKEITHVFAGDPYLAHEKGCEIEKEISGVKVDQAFDIVLTTNSGAPLDLDFYQTCKGVDNASRIVRPGGIIIIAAACDVGLGPQVFESLHADQKTPQAVLQKIKSEGPIGVQWQNQVLARVQVTNDIFLVSELDDSQARKMMVTPFSSIDAALSRAVEILGKDSRIAVMPEGPLVLPILEAKS